VDAAAERVHHGVQIRADPQPEQRDVVRRVSQHSYVSLRHRGAQSAQEASSSDAARWDHDVHAAQSDTVPNHSAERLNITVRLD